MGKAELQMLLLFLIYYAPVFLLVLSLKIPDFRVYSKRSTRGKGRRTMIFAVETAAAAVFLACAVAVAFFTVRENNTLLWILLRYVGIPAGLAILMIFIFSRIEPRLSGEPGVCDAASELSRISVPVIAVFVPVYALECVFALLVTLSSGWNLGDGIIEDLAGAFARATGSFWGPALSFSLIGVTFAAAVAVKCVMNRRRAR